MTDTHGWLFNNPDTGIEWSEQHPIESGEVPDAENVRPASAEELVTLLREAWNALAALEAKLAEARKALDASASALEEAREDVEHWGAYAGEYFQDKHDLDGDLDRIARQASAARRALTGGDRHGE